jgi:taurine dioxygenase
MPVTIHPFAAPLGAEILGLDLRAPIPGDARRALQLAFERYHVLLVRDQVLDEAQQVAFASCFGEVESARQQSVLAERPETMLISNVKVDGKNVGRLPDGEIEWHFDKMYYPEPNLAAVLHAVELPDQGGETLFCDTSLIYDALSDTEKRRLERLHVTSSYDYEATRPELRAVNSEAPRSTHPLVRTLSDGRHSIFAAPLMVDGIVELPSAESDATLASLYRSFGRAEYTYEHVWRIGDTLIWDNRCCAHKRNDFDPNQRRLLRRVSIADPAFAPAEHAGAGA